MRTYKNKEELKSEINQIFEKYISEFDTIPEFLKDKRVTEVDRMPAENLAYQVGWTTLLLKWEADEKHGIERPRSLTVSWANTVVPGVDSNKTITSTNTKTPLSRFMPYFLPPNQMGLNISCKSPKTYALRLLAPFLASF